jgi:hypothetical protein
VKVCTVGILEGHSSEIPDFKTKLENKKIVHKGVRYLNVSSDIFQNLSSENIKIVHKGVQYLNIPPEIKIILRTKYRFKESLPSRMLIHKYTKIKIVHQGVQYLNFHKFINL